MIVKRNSSSDTKLGAGLHLATISELYLLKKDGHSVKDEYGNLSVVAVFRSKEKHFKQVFSLAPGKKWMIDKLLDAIDYDRNEPIEVDKIIKRKVYIIIYEEHQYFDEKPKLDTNGHPIIYTRLRPLFYKYIKGVQPPAIGGVSGLDERILKEIKEVTE